MLTSTSETCGRSGEGMYKLKTIEICPQKIYQFQADDSVTDLIKSLLVNEEWTSNTTAEGWLTNALSCDKRLHKDDRYSSFTNWLEDCIETVRSEQNYECEKLSITQMWGSIGGYNSWHQTHTHNYSIISGVFYVTDSNAKTWFSVPSIWERLNLHPTFESMPVTRHNTTDPISKIPSEKGKLIIFPSSLTHSVDEHMDPDNYRYTMSFNTFPSGDVGDFSAAAGLNIEVL